VFLKMSVNLRTVLSAEAHGTEGEWLQSSWPYGSYLVSFEQEHEHHDSHVMRLTRDA
jgi:hypothetical protein